MINQWYELEELLEWLDEAIDKNYKILSKLVPVWKNFLKITSIILTDSRKCLITAQSIYTMF